MGKQQQNQKGSSQEAILNSSSLQRQVLSLSSRLRPSTRRHSPTRTLSGSSHRPSPCTDSTMCAMETPKRVRKSPKMGFMPTPSQKIRLVVLARLARQYLHSSSQGVPSRLSCSDILPTRQSAPSTSPTLCWLQMPMQYCWSSTSWRRQLRLRGSLSLRKESASWQCGQASETKASQAAVKSSTQQLTVLATRRKPSLTMMCVSKSRTSSRLKSSRTGCFLSSAILAARMAESLDLTSRFSSRVGSRFCLSLRWLALFLTVRSGLQRYWKQNLLIISASSIFSASVRAPSATSFIAWYGNPQMNWSRQWIANACVSRFIAIAPQIRPSMFRHRLRSRSCVSLRCLLARLRPASTSLAISALVSAMKLLLGARLRAGAEVGRREVQVWGSGQVAWELREVSLAWSVGLADQLGRLLGLSGRGWWSRECVLSELRHLSLRSVSFFSSAFCRDLLCFFCGLESSREVKFREKLCFDADWLWNEQFFCSFSLLRVTNLPCSLMTPRLLGSLSFWKAEAAQSLSSWSEWALFSSLPSGQGLMASLLRLKLPQSVLSKCSSFSFFLLVLTLYFAQQVLTPQSFSISPRRPSPPASSRRPSSPFPNDFTPFRFFDELCRTYFFVFETLAPVLPPFGSGLPAALGFCLSMRAPSDLEAIKLQQKPPFPRAATQLQPGPDCFPPCPPLPPSAADCRYQGSDLAEQSSEILDVGDDDFLELVGDFAEAGGGVAVAVDEARPLDVVLALGEVLLLGLDGDQLLERQPVEVLGGRRLSQQFLLVEHLVDVARARLGGDLLLGLHLLRTLAADRGGGCPRGLLQGGSGRLDLPHQFLPFLLLLLVVLVHLLLLFLLALLVLVLRLSLIEVTVELIPARTALDIILLVIIAVVQISEVLLSLLCPEGVLLFLLLPVYQVVHLRPSPFPELHIPDRHIFRLQFGSGF